MARAVFSMYVMSGSRLPFSGVGTQRMSASACEALRKSMVAVNGFSAPVALRMRSPAMCLMYVSPFSMASILRWSMSKPTTGKPFSPKVSASGRPT